MSGPYYLILWKKELKSSILNHNEVEKKLSKSEKVKNPERASLPPVEEDEVWGAWRGKKFAAKVLRISGDGRYLEALRVGQDGTCIPKDQPIPPNFKEAKMRKQRRDRKKETEALKKSMTTLEAAALNSNFLDASSLKDVHDKPEPTSSKGNQPPTSKVSAQPTPATAGSREHNKHLQDVSVSQGPACSDGCKKCCSLVKYLLPVFNLCPAVTNEFVSDLQTSANFFHGIQAVQSMLNTEHPKATSNGEDCEKESTRVASGNESWRWGGPGKVELVKHEGVWIKHSDLTEAKLKALNFKTNPHLELMRQLLLRLIGERALRTMSGAVTSIPEAVLSACQVYCNTQFKVNDSRAVYVRTANLFLQYRRGLAKGKDTTDTQQKQTEEHQEGSSSTCTSTLPPIDPSLEEKQLLLPKGGQEENPAENCESSKEREVIGSTESSSDEDESESSDDSGTSSEGSLDKKQNEFDVSAANKGKGLAKQCSEQSGLKHVRNKNKRGLKRVAGNIHNENSPIMEHGPQKHTKKSSRRQQALKTCCDHGNSPGNFYSQDASSSSPSYFQQSQPHYEMHNPHPAPHLSLHCSDSNPVNSGFISSAHSYITESQCVVDGREESTYHNLQ